MSQNRFASVPNISIPRSRFHQPFNHATSFKHGWFYPIDCFEILPGDTYHLNLNSIIWMSNPIVPIFGNITASVHAFFVPMRLVWDHTQEFYGENKTSAGYQTVNYKIPTATLANVHYASLSHYLGKPYCGSATANSPQASVLKERGYWLIWNNYVRPQQLVNPVLLNTSGNGSGASIGTKSGTSLGFNSEPGKCYKEFDYFTACTTAPQYGPAVTLPLGNFAPIITKPVSELAAVDDAVKTYAAKTGNALKWLTVASSPVIKVGEDLDGDNTLPLGIGSTKTIAGGDALDVSGGADAVVPANLYADLGAATAATINELRYAFAVQKYLERANFGTRFFEVLNLHYGISSPDATLQIPQRLGSGTINIAVNTVLSTAGAADDTSTKLGQPGAVSCSARKNMSLFTKAFVEPGYLYVCIEFKHERSYTQGLMREDFKSERYEFYSPEFANLGDQAVLKKEIMCGASTDNDVFGYQEHWAEYRYRPQRVSGILDPQVPSSMPFWTLADDYETVPELNGTWLEEDRNAISRCLVTGDNGPDYIADFYFDYTATREMPFFTIPGLIDHFGAM